MTDPIQFISVNDLLPALRPMIEAAVEQTMKRDLQERLLSIEATCSLFVPKITAPTLKSLTKKGILTRHFIGKRPYYKYSEVMEAAATYTRYKR